jgi:hypothetical protein
MAQGEKNTSNEKGKEVSSSILEIEKAYLDLMNAYSLVLAILRKHKFEDTAALFNYTKIKVLFLHYIFIPFYVRGIFGHNIVKWRIGASIDSLLEAFLLLITQNRHKNNIEVIKRFELYLKDITKMESLFAKSDLKPLIYGAITTLPLLFIGILELCSEYFDVIDLKLILLLLTLVLLYIFSLFSVFYTVGYMGSWFVFREAEVIKREEKLFTLFQKYMK